MSLKATSTVMTSTRQQPAARSLHAICELTRLASCGCCTAVGPDQPCVQSATEPDGLHVARFAEARRRRLIAAADFAAVVRTAGAFTNATVIYDDTLGKIR